MRNSQKVKPVLVYFKSDAGSTEENGGYKHYKPFLTCTCLFFISS
jgi:hypothetical protein